MWPKLITAGLGIWTMAAPSALGYGRPAATSDWIAGPLIASFAVMAIWDILRPLRWANVPLGLWLAAAPWVLAAQMEAKLNGTIVGLLVASLAFAGGRVAGRYAGGWANAWPFTGRSQA